MTLLDPVHGALAGAEAVGQLLLGEPAMRASVPDELPDAALEVLGHVVTVSHL
jgi:hypothetical protein